MYKNYKITFFMLLLVTMLAVNATYADTAINGQYTINTPGKYYLTDNITVSSGNVINIQCNDVILDGKGFTINDSSTTTVNYGIDISNANNVTIKNFNISNVGRGIGIGNSNNVTIINNTIINNSNGIRISNSNNNSIINNNVSSNSVNGIYLITGSNNNSIINNNISSNKEYGIHSSDDSNGLIITNNTISLNKYGIDLQTLDNTTITSNTIVSNIDSGIDLYHVYNTKIMDNNISLNKNYGILLAEITNISIINNTINSNTESGIHMYLVAGIINIINNTANSNKYGINLKNVDNAIFINNTVNSNDYYGIYLLYSNNNSIINNNASLNTQCGIRIDNCDNNSITNNTANSNDYHGIYARISNNNTIINNTANSNIQYGIYIYKTRVNTVLDNNANSNIQYGILVEYVDNSTIINNTIINNSNGIRILNSNNNSIINNTANSNDYYGIYARISNNNSIINNTANSNDYNGIYLSNANNNTIIGNIFNNTANIGLSSCGLNYWNTTKEKGGGNTWVTPTGTGFSETHPDTNNDGFCDEIYDISKGNIDYLAKYIDTTGPIITVHSPANKSIFTKNSFKVNITAVDSSGVDKIVSEFYGYNRTMAEYPTYYYLGFNEMLDGNYSFTFYAFDNLGHRSVKKLWVVVYTKAPEITINNPINNKVYNTSDIFINATATDAIGIKEVMANINGTNITMNINNSYYTLSKNLSDDKYSLKVYAEDNAGNKSVTDEITFSVDTTAPKVTLNSPIGLQNKANITINATVTDSTGIKSVMAELNGENNTLTLTDGYYIVNKTLMDNNYALKIYAIDNVDNKAVTPVSVFKVDTTAPYITINSPNGTLKTDKFLINVSSYEGLVTSGIKEVIANINNENITLTKTGDYYLAEKTLNDGTYLLNVTSIDNANNSNSTSTTFTIDTYVPSSNNNNRRRTIDASDSIESKSLRRTVSDSKIVYGSNFDKQLAN
ncbi:parallel beta-helix repeat protein, partial [Methanococcus voltae PS]